MSTTDSAPNGLARKALENAGTASTSPNSQFYDSSKIPGLDPNYTITEQPIGTRRHIRVACMGAGYSGLMMAIVFSEQMKDKNAELVIYERNEDLGGTWLENKLVNEVIQSGKRSNNVVP